MEKKDHPGVHRIVNGKRIVRPKERLGEKIVTMRDGLRWLDGGMLVYGSGWAPALLLAFGLSMPYERDIAEG